MKIFLSVLILLCCATNAFADKDWKEYKTDSFKVLAHQVDGDFVQTVMDEAEITLGQVLDNFGLRRYQIWSRQNPVLIVIYKDEEDYVHNGGQARWSHGAALIQSRAIRTYPSASGFFDSILPHELGHIVLHEHIGTQIPVPLWFDEGVAMYQEKAKNVGSHKAVLEAVKNGAFIPLTELMNVRLYSQSDSALVKLFYLESASIVNFMITEFGDYRFKKLCSALKENRSFENAIIDIYPRVKSFDDLNKQWRDFLESNE